MPKYDKFLEYSLLIIAILIAVFYYWPILYAPFNHDAYKLLTANQGPSSYSWEYWKYVLTHQTHGGAQYRPLSYFFYLFSLRHIFGTTPLCYHITALGIFSFSIIALWTLLKKFNNHSITTFTVIFLFIFYTGHFALLEEVASNFKYYIPLIFLIIGISLILKKEALTKSKYLFLLILLSISIMSHEGSFTFAIVLLLIRHTHYRISITDIIFITAPAIIYMITRIFIFTIPTTGFMSLDLSLIPTSIIYYIDYILHKTAATSLFIITSISISSYLAWKKKDYLPTVYLVSIIILLLPFSALKNHFFLNRSLFATIPAALFLNHVLSKIKKSIYVSIIPTVTLFILIFSWSEIHEAKYLNYSQYVALENKIYQYIKNKTKHISADNIINITLLNVAPPHFNYYVVKSILPGMLALNVPTKKFLIVEKYLANSSFIYIDKGFTYYSPNKKDWSDTFHYNYRFEIEASPHTLTLDIAPVYKMYNYRINKK